MELQVHAVDVPLWIEWCGLRLHVHVTEFAVQNKKLELQFTPNEGALEKPLRTLWFYAKFPL